MAKVKELVVDDLVNEINKKWPGAIIPASDPSLLIQKIPSGILSVDYLLGGGFPRNRHIEIYGNPATGKTYMAMKLIANAQNLGLKCAYIDNERSFDPKFAELCGVDLEALYYHRQQTGNRVIDFIETLLRSGEIDVIVMDSIASLIPQQELTENMEKGSFGTQQAKLMSAAMRRLTAANDKTVIVYINQLRDNLGSMFKASLTSGGRAMSFYAGIRLQMAKVETLKRDEKVFDHTGKEVTSKVPWGHRVEVKVEKSKVGGARTLDKVAFVFDYNAASIDYEEDLIYMGIILRLIKRSANTWFIEGTEHKAVGRDKFKDLLRNDKEAFNYLNSKVREVVYA